MHREIAQELHSILITVFPDADTFDALRPDETDIETTVAAARASATEMAAAGVDVFVSIQVSSTPLGTADS